MQEITCEQLRNERMTHSKETQSTLNENNTFRLTNMSCV